MATRKITGLMIKLGLDVSGVEGGFKSIDKAITQSMRELKNIDKALKFDPTNTELLAQKQEVLAQALEKSRERLKGLEDAQEKMAKAAANNPAYEQAYEPLAKSLDKAKKKLAELEKQKEEMDAKLASGEINQKQYDQYIKKLNEAEQAQKTLEQQKKELDARFSEGHISVEEYRLYKRELEQVRAETARLEKESKQLENVTDKSSLAFRKAVESTKEYQQAIEKINASAGDLKNKVGGALNEIWDIALKVGTAITSAAVAAGAAAVKIGSDFDVSMSNVAALSGAVGNELDTLREKAKEMGATTSRTAKESADALGYMALAGWDTTQMLEGLEPILRASEAGSMDLATASDLVTDSMSAMGLSVNDLTHYLDVATKAQSSSNTSLEQLLNAYVVAGGAFKNFNISIEESATLLGTLANRGIKGSEAGNALNSVLINLVGANKNAASALDALGVSAYDADGKFIGITETLKLVAKSLKNVSEQDKAVFTAKIGGKTQYDTLQALLSGVNEEYDELYGKIQDSNGALEETAKIMRDNLKGDVTALKSALEGLGIEVNDQFTEAFREAVQVATKEVAKLSKAVSEGELGESLRKIAEAFAKLIEKIVEFAANKGIPKTIEFFEFIADNGETVKNLIVSIGSAFVAWKFGSTIIGIYKAYMKFKVAATESAIAQQAFNNVLKANIYLAVASALISMATALSVWLKTHSETKNQMSETEAAIYSEIEALKKEKEEFDNLKHSQNEKLLGDVAQINHTESLWKELKKYVDENGNVIKCNERASEIIGTLNEAYGLNIEYIDGQIKGYGDLATAMEGYFDKLRLEAKINYAKGGYEQAVTEIEKVKAQNKELIQQKGHLWREYRALINEAEEIGNKDFDAQYRQALKLEEADKKAVEWNAVKIAIEENERLMSEYSNTITDFENLVSQQYQEINSEIDNQINNTTDNVEKNTEELIKALKKEIEALDYKKNIHGFADDTAYWSERRQVLNKYLLRESEEWWKYYDETEKYFEKLTEEQKKAYEQQISDQAEALKERKELEDDFTDEMYYDELEKLISVLSKESDTYKKYNSEILKGRKKLGDDLAKEAAASAKEQAQTQIESVKNSVSEIKAEYSKMLSDVVSEREAYRNKLSGMAELYTSEKKDNQETFTLKNIDEQIKAIEEADDKLKDLETRGAGKSLVSYIQGLSDEDANKLMHVLGNMTDEQLKEYSEKYDKLTQTINDRVAARYDPQIEAINQAFSKKIKSEFGNLSEDLETLGIDAIDGFIKGFTEDPEKLVEAVAEQCNAVLDGFKKGLDIHSPSKKTEEMGEYAGAGFEKGLEKMSGADAAESFVDDFILKMAEKDSQLHDVLYNVFAGNTADAIAGMNEEASKAMNNIVPALQLPDITKFTLPKSAELSLSAQRADERVVSLLQDISDHLQNIIMLFSAVLSQNRTEQINLTSTINTYLDGALLAKTVTKQQAIQRKGNGS